LEKADSIFRASTTSASLRRTVLARDSCSGKTLRASCMVSVLNPSFHDIARTSRASAPAARRQSTPWWR